MSYTQTSAFARAKYTTTATEIIVTLISPARASFPTMVGLGVYVDGVFQEAIEPPNEYEYQTIINFAAGSKTIEFVNGLQSSPTQTFPAIGTFFISADANAAMTAVSETATNRILIYGDSIAVGANATTPTDEGWGILLRKAHSPNSVAFEACGYRSLYMDASDATARAEFIEKVVAYSPEILWMAIGHNDYGLTKWSAAAFGVAYAAVLDDLHSVLPTLDIYCQTPLLAASEIENGLGSTLGNYRTQIGAAVSTRTGFCMLVDGTEIMTLASIPDGVHPDIAGHVLYANYVKTVLGIT